MSVSIVQYKLYHKLSGDIMFYLPEGQVKKLLAESFTCPKGK